MQEALRSASILGPQTFQLAALLSGGYILVHMIKDRVGLQELIPLN